MKKSLDKSCFLSNSNQEFAIDFANDGGVLVEIINLHEITSDFKFNKYYDVINAEISGTLFCFYGCILKKGRNKVKAIYEVEGYFEGVHLDNLNDVLVKSYSFRVQNSVLKLFEAEFSNLKINELRETSVKINDVVTLQYKSCLIKKEYKEEYVNKEILSHRFTFSYENEVNLEDVYNHLNIFKQFLDFSISSETTIYPNSLVIKSSDVVLKNDKRIINPNVIYNDEYVSLFNKTKRFISNKNADDKELRKAVYNSFFKYDKIFTVLKQWFNNEKYRTIYYLYIDSNDWLENTDRLLSNVMFNNRFLNMIQGLEYFHLAYTGISEIDNELFDNSGKVETIKELEKILEPDLFERTKTLFGKNKQKRKIHLNERIDGLFDLNENLIHGLFYDNFSKETRKFRDDLSHGKTECINQGVNLELRFYQAKYLLLCCILKTLNLEDRDLNAIVENNVIFLNLRNKINHRINLIDG